MIEIPQPSIALNSHDVPGTRYEMWETWDVPSNVSVDTIVTTVGVLASFTDEKIKCLIINCHGNYGKASGKSISTGGFGFSIGTGIDSSNVSRFSKLYGLVECIVIVACGAAYITNPGTRGDGDLLCKNLAKAAGAYVIAPKTLQIERVIKMPENHIDNFEGLVVRYNKSGALDGSKLLGRKLISEVVS